MYRGRGKNRIDVPDCGRRRLLFRVMWWGKKKRKERRVLLSAAHSHYYGSIGTTCCVILFLFHCIEIPQQQQQQQQQIALSFQLYFPLWLISFLFFGWVEHEENWTGSFYIHSPFTLLSSSSPIRLRVWHILVYSTHTQRNAFLYFIFDWEKDFRF